MTTTARLSTAQLDRAVGVLLATAAGMRWAPATSSAPRSRCRHWSP